MKKLSMPFYILAALILGAPGYCQNAVAVPVAERSVFWPQSMNFMLNPWVTAGILAAGMMLVVSEVMTSGRRGIVGAIGILCLGCVVISYSLAGIASWAGVLLMLAGVGLLLVEAHVLPGHGISALAGSVCVFLGTYGILGGALTVAHILISAMVAAFSMITLLVYLPRSCTWRTLAHNVDTTIASRTAVKVDVGHVNISQVQTSVHTSIRTKTGPEPVVTTGSASAVDEDIQALERIEARTDEANAEADAFGDATKPHKARQDARKKRASKALTDMKADLGRTQPGYNPQTQTSSTEEPKQQIVGHDSPESQD